VTTGRRSPAALWELLVDDDRGSTVYLTTDKRVIVHDEKQLRYEVVRDPQSELRGLTPGTTPP
jgi:hypothetical protein